MDTPAIVPCARCKKVPEPFYDGAYTYISCHDCYDGAPDSATRSEVGAWYSKEGAIEEWNEKMADLADELVTP